MKQPQMGCKVDPALHQKGQTLAARRKRPAALRDALDFGVA